MKFNRKDEPLDLGVYWHFDCRLADELPEDNVVRLRFLVDVVLGAVAFALLLLCAWFAYTNGTLGGSIADWERRLAANQKEAEDLRKLQQSTNSTAKRIDQAYELAGSPFLTSLLLLDLGRTRPADISLESIALSETTLVVRGSVNQPSDRATQLLSRYIDILRQEPALSAHFKDIILSAFDRVGLQGDAQTFEITMRKK